MPLNHLPGGVVDFLEGGLAGVPFYAVAQQKEKFDIVETTRINTYCINRYGVLLALL